MRGFKTTDTTLKKNQNTTDKKTAIIYCFIIKAPENTANIKIMALSNIVGLLPALPRLIMSKI